MVMYRCRCLYRSWIPFPKELAHSLFSSNLTGARSRRQATMILRLTILLRMRRRAVPPRRLERPADCRIHLRRILRLEHPERLARIPNWEQVPNLGQALLVEVHLSLPVPLPLKRREQLLSKAARTSAVPRAGTRPKLLLRARRQEQVQTVLPQEAARRPRRKNLRRMSAKW